MTRLHLYWALGGLALYWFWRKSTVKVVSQQEYNEAKARAEGTPVHTPTNGGATFAPPAAKDTVYEDGYVIGYRSPGTGGPLLGFK